MFIRTACLVCPGKVLVGRGLELVRKLRVKGADLAVIACEVQVMEGMMGWSVDNMLQGVPSDHVRIMDLSAV